MNLGFGDVSCLTSVVERAVSDGADIGSLSYLRDYQTGRQRHNVAVMATIHGLHHLYSTTWTPIVMLRSIGFSVLDAVPAVKQLITKRAAT